LRDGADTGDDFLDDARGEGDGAEEDRGEVDRADDARAGGSGSAAGTDGVAAADELVAASANPLGGPPASRNPTRAITAHDDKIPARAMCRRLEVNRRWPSPFASSARTV
jgi:hypothetical protein